MLSSSGAGGGRRRARGFRGSGVAGSGLDQYSLPRRPGLHCLREMAVPFGNQTHGIVANVVIK